MSEIIVNLMTPKGRCIQAYWTDPTTGLQKTRSTGTHKQRDAERFRAKLELDLNNESADENASATWATAADRYENENLASRAPKTLRKFRGTRIKLETHINPLYVKALNAATISRFQAALRSEQLAESTIKSHLAHLKACLNWMNRMGYLKKMPIIDMPKRVEKMRGRAITEEEFERILAKLDPPTEPNSRPAIPSDPAKISRPAIHPELAPEWRLLIRGLWLSGLRLGEALILTWDHGPLAVTISGPPEKPIVRLKIQANTDKSTQFRILPITPDFAEFLLAIPAARRHGRVFRPIVPGQKGDMRLDTASKFIEKLGRLAGVIECERQSKDGTTETVKKYASAHCYRRSFGTRWAKKVPAQVLKVLMRHKNIKTTLDFYADIDAASVEAALQQNIPNSSPNTSTKPTRENSEKH